jgi:hypothetical protein
MAAGASFALHPVELTRSGFGNTCDDCISVVGKVTVIKLLRYVGKVTVIKLFRYVTSYFFK